MRHLGISRAAKGRLAVRLPLARRLPFAAAPDVVTLLPVDVGVVLARDNLPSKFHGGPADRVITATARAYALSLATHDSDIRKSGCVKVWRGG